jgi:hypothetical protein
MGVWILIILLVFGIYLAIGMLYAKKYNWLDEKEVTFWEGAKVILKWSLTLLKK